MLHKRGRVLLQQAAAAAQQPQVASTWPQVLLGYSELDTLQGPLSRFMAGEICGSSSTDWQALGQAHTAVVAGACLALGVCHAGSASAEAEGVLRHYLLYLLEAKRQAPERQACELTAPVPGLFRVVEHVLYC